MRFLIRASYIHHEVLDCFPFFCWLSFLELVNSGSHTIRRLWIVETCVTIRELDCPFLSMRQRHSLHCDTISARFEFFQSLLSTRRSLILHGKSCGFTSMDCVKNTFRVNDETTSDLGNSMIDYCGVITSLHNFQPQESYEFGLFLCQSSSLCLSRTR